MSVINPTALNSPYEVDQVLCFLAPSRSLEDISPNHLKWRLMEQNRLLPLGTHKLCRSHFHDCMMTHDQLTH